MQLTKSPPNFGATYDVGWVGFTFITGDLVGDAIAYFRRRWGPPPGDPKVTHTFIVDSTSQCLEAHLDEGVAIAPLAKYFRDPRCQVFFRKPVGWNLPLGERTALAARARVGDKYGLGLILADAAANTLLGRFVNRVCEGRPSLWAEQEVLKSSRTPKSVRNLSPPPWSRSRNILEYPRPTS